MLHLNIPNSPGEPIWWWGFWFVASLIIYAALMTYFYRAGKRETREAEHRAGRDRSS